MKYNKSNIMKRAWELVKKASMTISEGLKKAWAEAKNTEKTLEEKVMDELKALVEDATDVFNYNVSSKLWEKYGKSRTYFKIVETRNNSKHYTEYDFGYIDNKTNEYHAGKKDAFGKFNLTGALR